MSSGRTEDLRARVLAEVAQTPSPTRAEHRRRTLVVSLSAVASLAVLFFALGGCAPGDRPTALVWFTFGGSLATALVMSWLGSTRARGSMLGRPARVLAGGAASAATVLVLVVAAAALSWPDAARVPTPGGLDLACAGIALAEGALPFAALLFLRRHTDPVHPAITGAVLGMTAGAWTASLSYLRCPHASSAHCMLAHVLPALVLAALGAALGPVVLRLRGSERAR